MRPIEGAQEHGGGLESPSVVCVAFATRGRAPVLAHAIQAVDAQSVRPHSIIVSYVSDEDVEGLPVRPDIVLVKAKPGLTKQRNAALDALPENADFVVFFDDDFIAHPSWIEQALAVFSQRPSVSGLTGTVIADGITGPGYTVGEALTLLSNSEPTGGIVGPYVPYGCNMAFRLRAIEGLRFDERLVLYAWQEDRDFGAQVVRKGGEVVKIKGALGVHLGTKKGRMPGRKLGYSQVVNPVYLKRKGTMDLGAAAAHIARNVLMNLVRSMASEPYIDRRGRLVGNLLGLRALTLGRIFPEHAERL